MNEDSTSGGIVPPDRDMYRLIVRVVEEAPQHYVISATDLTSRVTLAAYECWPGLDRHDLRITVESTIGDVEGDSSLRAELGLRRIVTEGLFDADSNAAHVYVSTRLRPDLVTPEQVRERALPVLHRLGTSKHRGDLKERAVSAVVETLPGFEELSTREWLPEALWNVDHLVSMDGFVVVLEDKSSRAQMLDRLDPAEVARAQRLAELGIPQVLIVPAATERAKERAAALAGGIIELLGYLVLDAEVKELLDSELGTPWPTVVLDDDGLPPLPMRRAIEKGLAEARGQMAESMAGHDATVNDLVALRRQRDLVQEEDWVESEVARYVSLLGRPDYETRVYQAERLIRFGMEAEDPLFCCGCGGTLERLTRLGIRDASLPCRNVLCALRGLDQSARRWTMTAVGEVIGKAENGKPLTDRTIRNAFTEMGHENVAKPGRPTKQPRATQSPVVAETPLPDAHIRIFRW